MIIIFWYFILGIIFISIIFPILNGISEVILAVLEVLKNKLNVKAMDATITEERNAFNFKLECAKKEEEFGADEGAPTVIGFGIPDDVTEDEVIEDDE